MTWTRILCQQSGRPSVYAMSIRTDLDVDSTLHIYASAIFRLCSCDLLNKAFLFSLYIDHYCYFFSKCERLCAVEKVFHRLVTRVTVRGHFSVALLWLFYLIPMYICNNAVNGTCCILFWNYYTFKEKEIVYFHPI